LHRLDFGHRTFALILAILRRQTKPASPVVVFQRGPKRHRSSIPPDVALPSSLFSPTNPCLSSYQGGPSLSRSFHHVFCSARQLHTSPLGCSTRPCRFGDSPLLLRRSFRRTKLPHHPFLTSSQPPSPLRERQEPRTCVRPPAPARCDVVVLSPFPRVERAVIRAVCNVVESTKQSCRVTGWKHTHNHKKDARHDLTNRHPRTGQSPPEPPPAHPSYTGAVAVTVEPPPHTLHPLGSVCPS